MEPIQVPDGVTHYTRSQLPQYRVTMMPARRRSPPSIKDTRTPPAAPSAVVSVQRNTDGRDFVVGDIHGMFACLEKLLDSIHFDPDRDRLFSVGDLIDRGPSSHLTPYYLLKPWFHAIRGNHEDMLIRHCESPDDSDLYEQWMANGGSWWEHIKAPLDQEIYRCLRRLPLAMEVETRLGPVGIVHADIPIGSDWPGFLAALSAGDPETLKTALWSRQRAYLWRIAGPVAGAHNIYCGHTMVETPRSAGNVHFIDTGACYPRLGRLTAVELGQGVKSATSVAA